MTEIFADGVRAIAVANGVARIELSQLRRSNVKDKESEMRPETVATLLLPVSSLKELSRQLNAALVKVQEGMAQRGGEQGQDSSDVDEALRNL